MFVAHLLDLCGILNMMLLHFRAALVGLCVEATVGWQQFLHKVELPAQYRFHRNTYVHAFLDLIVHTTYRDLVQTQKSSWWNWHRIPSNCNQFKEMEGLPPFPAGAFLKGSALQTALDAMQTPSHPRAR